MAPVPFTEASRWMLAVRDRRDMGGAQAGEVDQQVMLVICRKAARFDRHRAQVSARIYQIAPNGQIDLIRKEHSPVPEALAEDPGAEPDALIVAYAAGPLLRLFALVVAAYVSLRLVCRAARHGDLAVSGTRLDSVETPPLVAGRSEVYPAIPARWSRR